MTAAAITVGSALAVVWAGAWVAAWWDARQDRQWRDEPLSRLDHMDGLHDRDEVDPWLP